MHKSLRKLNLGLLFCLVIVVLMFVGACSETTQTDNGNISGTVLDKYDSTHIAEANISIDETHVVQSNSLGAYTILDVEPGVYTAIARMDGYFLDSINIEVVKGNTANANFLLEKSCTVSGNLYGDGVLVPYDVYPAHVELVHEGTVAYETVINTSGAYRFENIKSGNYEIHGYKSYYGNEASTSRLVQINANNTNLGQVYLDSIRQDYFPISVGDHYKYNKHFVDARDIPAQTMEDEGYIYRSIYSNIDYSVIDKVVSDVTVYHLNETTTQYYKTTTYNYFSSTRPDSIIVDSTVTTTQSIILITETNGVFESDEFGGGRMPIAFHFILDNSSDYSVTPGPNVSIEGQSYSTLVIFLYNDETLYFSPNIGLTKYEWNYVGHYSFQTTINLVEF